MVPLASGQEHERRIEHQLTTALGQSPVEAHVLAVARPFVVAQTAHALAAVQGQAGKRALYRQGLVAAP
jgi:hypothetical protein